MRLFRVGFDRILHLYVQHRTLSGSIVYFAELVVTKPVQDFLQKLIPPVGDATRDAQNARRCFGGEASDLNSNRVELRMQGPEGYTIRDLAAVNIAQKVLGGISRRGLHTPAKSPAGYYDDGKTAVAVFRNGTW